jgi:TRAP-type C4-dicarboxylate transport system substrate-binding protein
MNMNVKIGKIVSLALAATMLAGAARAEIVLTVANWLPPSHPLVSEVIVPMTVQIAEATGGAVSATILPAPLGPPAAHYDFAVNGVADITFGVLGYSPGRFKTSNIAEVPFLGDNAEATSVAYWRTWDAMLKDSGEFDDVKMLAVFTHGPGAVFLKEGDGATVDLLAGQKLRVGGGIVHEVASNLGAVPVEGPSSKAFELLSQGVADGILFPAESVAFFNLIPQLSVGVSVPGGLYNTAFFIAMNKTRFESLTPEQQAQIDSVTGEALARMAGQMWDRADSAGLAAMEGKITVTPATDAQLASWTESLAPIVAAKVAELSERGVDGEAALAMMRAEIAAESVGQ